MLKRHIQEPRRVRRQPEPIEIATAPESAWSREREVILDVIDRIADVGMFVVILRQQHRGAEIDRLSPPFTENRALQADSLYHRRIGRRLDWRNRPGSHEPDWRR